jgi:hypothetical protein
MGLIPATGSEVSMGRIGQALGLGTAGVLTNVGLNSTLGTNRGLSTSGVAGIPTGSITQEGSSFGGLQTTGTY